MSKFVPFDHIMLAAVAQELQRELSRCRLAEAWAPSGSILALKLRGQGRSRYLLVSIHPRFARIHLVSAEPPSGIAHPFVLLLRKHLEGAKLQRVEVPFPLERILHLIFEGVGSAGEPVTLVLCAELMGKHSNLILWEEPSKRILGSFKTVTETQSIRPVYGGLVYQLPPQPLKKAPFLNSEGFMRELNSAQLEEPETLLNKWAQERYNGITPPVAAYLFRDWTASRLGALPESGLSELAPRWAGFWERYQKKEFAELIPLIHPQWSGVPLGSQLAQYYETIEGDEKLARLRSRLTEVLARARERAVKEILLFKNRLREAETAETFQRYGELLKGSLHAVKKGESRWTGIDYFDPEMTPVAIPLDPQKSPQENMNAYFKKYRKATGGLTIIMELLQAKEEETAYLESVAFSAEEATSHTDLAEIERELEETGYLRPSGKKVRKPAKKEVQLLKFTSTDGYAILVGRNNLQNDYLTSRVAKDQDLWLHALGMPGSHVLIQRKKGEEIPETTLLEAAGVAAYFSKGRSSAKVQVLYTLAKYVTKIKGGKPGLVRYEKERSLVVEPKLMH